MNPLQEHAMLRTEAADLIAWGIERGWVVRPEWPPKITPIQVFTEAERAKRREYNKAYARRLHAANRAKGLTSAGTPRLRRRNGTVPKKSAYMAASRHGTLPKFEKGK